MNSTYDCFCLLALRVDPERTSLNHLVRVDLVDLRTKFVDDRSANETLHRGRVEHFRIRHILRLRLLRLFLLHFFCRENVRREKRRDVNQRKYNFQFHVITNFQKKYLTKSRKRQFWKLQCTMFFRRPQVGEMTVSTLIGRVNHSLDSDWLSRSKQNIKISRRIGGKFEIKTWANEESFIS